MYGVSKAILCGTVGKDPDVVSFPDGGKIANLPLATEKRAYKTQSGREVPKRTDWHNLVVKGNLVTMTEKYVKKGTNLYVEGEIVNRKYKTKDGHDRITTEIHVSEIHMLPESLSKKQREYLKTLDDNNHGNESQNQSQNQAQSHNFVTLSPDGDNDDYGNYSVNDDSYLTI